MINFFTVIGAAVFFGIMFLGSVDLIWRIRNTIKAYLSVRRGK